MLNTIPKNKIEIILPCELPKQKIHKYVVDEVEQLGFNCVYDIKYMVPRYMVNGKAYESSILSLDNKFIVTLKRADVYI